jgi:hypothetical protein
MAGVATNPVLLQEFSDNTFDKGVLVPNQISLKIDPASSVVVTTSATGLKLVAPVAPATTNVLAIDAVGKTITSTVNGVASTISTASLDDEGVTLAFSAGTLQLKNSAGTVLSSSPIPDLDAQTLTLGGTPAAPTLAISGGNTVNLPVVAPTTNTLAITKAGGAVSTVDGVVGTQTIAVGVLRDMLGFDATGNLVAQAVTIPKPIIFDERFATTAVDYSCVIGFRTPVNAAIDTLQVTTFVEVTATGATIGLPSIQPTVAQLIIGLEINVVSYGTWTGNTTVKSLALINGSQTAVINKTTTDIMLSPSLCFRWTGATWRIV